MVAGKSFLSGRDVELIQQVRRDALATKIALQSPQVSIFIRRVLAGTPTDLPGQIVALKIAYPGSPAGNDRDVINDDRLKGTIRREGLDAKPSDTFIVPGTKWMATVIAVHPVRADTIVEADIEVNLGSGR